MFELILFLTLPVLGYVVGSYHEKKHYRSIIEREKALLHIPVISSQWDKNIQPDDEGQIFGSGIVIGSDYFKSLAASIKNIFGGNLTVYESLLDRGRREAVLRMKEKAARWGCHSIINMRIETATIGNIHKKKGLPCIELFAYGTALRKPQAATPLATAPQIEQ